MRLQSRAQRLRKRFLSGSVVALSALLLVTAGAQTRPQYRFKSIDAPGSIYFTGILGINNRGDMAGVRDGEDGHAHGFLRVGERFYTIDVPGATDTNALNVTDDGDITGTFFDPDGFQHGYLLHKGHFTTIDVPGAAHLTDIPFEFGPGLGTALFRMNQRGGMVGEYADPAGFSHGFVLQNGQYHNIDVPNAGLQPGLGSEAIAINDSNTIAGLYFQDGSFLGHGFLLDRGHYTTIDFPGAGGTSGTQCNGLNNRGEVVGPYSDVNDHLHGYIWRHGEFGRIDYPGAVDSEADAINDRGVVIGQYTDSDGLVHGYVATPR